MIIGITGSIATGKSTASKYIASLGYQVIDSDKIVDKLLRSSPILKEIEINFGSNFIVNNQLDRKLMAELIFNNNTYRKLLNRIIHPKVINEIVSKTKEYKNSKDLIFVDIPLLYEEGLEYLVDKVIVVYIPESLQLKRLIKRDNISKEFAMKKIASTISIEEKKEFTNYVVDNSKKQKDLELELDAIIRRIQNEI